MSDPANRQMEPLSKDSEEKYRSALNLFKSGQSRLALDILDVVAKMEPDSAPVQLLIGKIYISMPERSDTNDIIARWLKRSYIAVRKAIELSDQYGGLGDQDLASAQEVVGMMETMAEERDEAAALLEVMKEAEDVRYLDVSAGASSDMVIELGESGIKINDQSFNLPVEIQEISGVIGHADRTSKLENDIHTWDDLGLCAYCYSGRDSVFSFNISLQGSDFPFRPKDVYRGILVIEGEEINKNWAYSQLKHLGFQANYSSLVPYEKQIGNYHIVIEGKKYSDSPVLVGITDVKN